MVCRSMVLALALGSSGMLGACGDSRGACTPGETQACACTDGTVGSRDCDGAGVPGACTCAPPGTDAGSRDGGVSPTDADAGRIPLLDSGPSASGGALGTGSARGTLVAPDLSCLGTRVAPAPTGHENLRIHATDFSSGFPVADLRLQVFLTDMPATDCFTGCVSATTDSSGNLVLATSVGGWLAIRVPEGVGTHDSRSEDYVTLLRRHAEASLVLETPAMRRSSLEVMHALLSLSSSPGTSTLMGTVRDCAGEPIANAEVRIFGRRAPIEAGFDGVGARAAYFNGDGFLDPAGRETHVDGLYGVFNIPLPVGGGVRVEAWGRLTPSGAPQMIACEEGALPSDGVALIDLGPTRADGPLGCSM